MNITTPDKNSKSYKQFVELNVDKVKIAMEWLSEHNIEYVLNMWVENHLYRLYIPSKDLLLDFEYYPENKYMYNYIRVNYNTDIIRLLEKIFPETILDTNELVVWKVNQRASNKFLRENNNSPIYDKNVLRIALVKDSIIYQCVIIKDNKIIANATKRNCSIPYGTYILLRYLNEIFGFSEIIIREHCDNSYNNILFQILNSPVIDKTPKRKIWWSPDNTKWRIPKSEAHKYIPFYFTEQITYKYP